MVMNYNQQSEDFNTLDRPIASKDNTVRFEDGSTMDIHEDSSLMESEIYTHVSHAMDDKVIAKIYDFVTEIAPLPSTLNDEDAKVVHECIGRQCDFFNNSTSQQERALFDALHLDERDAIRCFLHTYFSDLNDDAQYSFFDENPNALDELHRATNAMELVRKAYPDTVTTADNVTVYTKAAKAYVNNMPPAQLEANGHDVFEGQPRMIDALDTIEQLAKYDNAAAWKCYHDFMEKNLSGVSIEIKG